MYFSLFSSMHETMDDLTSSNAIKPICLLAEWTNIIMASNLYLQIS